MQRSSRHIYWLVLGLSIFAYLAINIQLTKHPRTSIATELQTRLPIFIQVIMGFGDKNLAANLSVFRALVASTETMEKDNYLIQGKVQQDAAFLNPLHEDNYYIAAAILPWNGELISAQSILFTASLNRQFDWQPGFYHAFNTYFFMKAPADAAIEILKITNRTSDPNDRQALQNVASLWIEKGYRTKDAAKIISAIAKQSKSHDFKNYLEARAERLNQLQQLNDAALQYRKLKGANPTSIADLVSARMIDHPPVDPLGGVFIITEQGDAILSNKPIK